MGTSNNPLTALESAAKADVTKSLSWLQKHERIVIVFLVLLAGTWFGNRWLDTRAAATSQSAAIAVQQLKEQQAKDAAMAAQVAQLSSQYQALVSEMASENARLAASMANRTIVLQQQQAADKTMPLPDLGAHWAELAGVDKSELTATSNGITVSDTAARATVQKLEQVPVLEANLKDETTVAANTQQELTGANNVIDGQKQQIAGLKLTVTDDEKVCKTQLAAQKAADNKSKRNWFLRGLALGAGGAVYLLLHF